MANAVVVMSGREIRAHAVNLVRRKLTEKGILPGAPWREVVAKLGLPPVQFRPLALSQDGLREGDQIVVNRNLSCDERIEFTIFHEIMHILLEEDGRIDSFLLEYLDYDSQEYRWQLENLCNLGAAEFVMPSEEFKSLMDTHEWQIASLDAVRNAFRCSLIAAAFHFAHHNPDPCSLVICEYRYAIPKPETGDMPLMEFGLDNTLQRPSNSTDLIVTYTAYNDGGFPMQRYKSVPHNHLIREAATGKQVVEGRAEPFFKQKAKGQMICHAAYLHGRVYAVYYRKERQWLSKRSQIPMDLFEL